MIRASVDTQALRYNLARSRKVAPGAKVMAVVKANAYGHGLLPAAVALSEADGFAVARIDEGIELRNVGLRHPILLLEGVFDAAQLAEAGHRGFELVVHSAEQIELLRAYRGKPQFRVWLKLDTGMNRLGFRPKDFEAAWTALRSNPGVRGDICIMSHLASADLTESDKTSRQLAEFARLTQGRTFEASIANSAGVLAWPEAHRQWIRPGLLLYGVSPFADKRSSDLGLIPAMTLSTQVIAVRDIDAGETVGYGDTWTARRPTTLAVIAAGYGDGYPRNVRSGTPVLINGKPFPLAGRVSMDMITVDVTDGPRPTVGDEVELWGKALPVEQVAENAGTIPYELLCGVSQRVRLDVI
jgi:alanine racemase